MLFWFCCLFIIIIISWIEMVLDPFLKTASLPSTLHWSTEFWQWALNNGEFKSLKNTMFEKYWWFQVLK